MNFKQPKSFLHHVFRASDADSRTKIKVGVIRTFNASHGDKLCFFKDGETIVITKNYRQPSTCLFQITVDVEGRARLSATNLKQLKAEYGDDLEIIFITNDRAIVNILKSSSNLNPQPIVPVTLEQLSEAILPEEVEETQTLSEGAATKITVNAYERNRKARERCLARYGLNCCVCGFNFGTRYGEIGKGYIHVHHLVPIASIGKEYDLNPERDLRPVCPNCHSMLHRKKDTPYTLEELRLIMRVSDNDVPPCN